jgi:hypothetical protein
LWQALQLPAKSCAGDFPSSRFCAAAGSGLKNRHAPTISGHNEIRRIRPPPLRIVIPLHSAAEAERFIT